jgi:SAM-dependent methyltransferase
MSGPPMSLTYNPEVFSVSDLSAAMRIILTPDGCSTEERWKTETPYLVGLIGQQLEITPQSVLLDYGCGIGRMAKELIAQHGCRVIGVDISASMRAMAAMYVDSNRFFACPPEMLDALVESGLTVDCAISIWVLQHCLAPGEDIARIRRGLRPSGHLFVLNNILRAVPTREHGWVNDGIDLRTELGREFSLVADGTPALEHTSHIAATSSFWATFTRS